MNPTGKKKAPPRQEPGAGAENQERTNRITGPADSKPHYDRDALEAMRKRLPDYLAARGMELRPQGARLLGRCPNHDDGNPSFAVFASGQACGCYPCGYSGDVFATSEWLGRASDFPSAVQDVAAVLGVPLPQAPAQGQPRSPQAPTRPAQQPGPPFELPEADKERIYAARLAFCHAFHGGDPIVDRIAASLGLARETLRVAAWGSSGLGLADGWLCYCYPSGLKWRNPHPQTMPRFRWIVGKATAPWRAEWIKPEVRDVFLTEGESDCLALIQAGLEVLGESACVASPGTSFSAAWAPLFTGKRVTLCFDRDAAGHVATAKVARLLKGTAAAISTWKGPHRNV